MTYSKSHPLALEGDYSYQGATGSCRASTMTGVVSSLSNVSVAAGKSSTLKAAIEKGPVSVTVEADTRVFQGYTGGVLNSASCGQQLDHAITAVGWGVDASGAEYYTVRNSWGAAWGDAGYLKIAAQASGKGICGIQQISVFPNTN